MRRLGMPWKGGSLIEEWIAFPTREGREDQGAEHVPLVAGVELDLLVRTSKLCFTVAIFRSPPCGSSLLSWLNSGSFQTVSFLSKSTYNSSSPSNSNVNWPLGP